MKRLEAEAVELCSYNNSVVDGLLQTKEYAPAVFAGRRPRFTEEEVEQQVAARLARQEIFDAHPRPDFSFVLCEATLRRLIGGKMVVRAQLERLLDVGQSRQVDIQVLPLSLEENSGLGGAFRLLKLKDGVTVGLNEVQLTDRVIADPRETMVPDMRYGILRAQALTPRDSLAFIDELLGET